MKLIAGINIPPKDDPGVIYRPPFLTYGYVPETPTVREKAKFMTHIPSAAHVQPHVIITHNVRLEYGNKNVACFPLSLSHTHTLHQLLEGSILKNLLLGVEKTGREPGAAEAWELARRLGLPSEFLGAPDSFSVGKGGRNLPLSARQIISICRVLLTDADVVMLHMMMFLALLARD